MKKSRVSDEQTVRILRQATKHPVPELAIARAATLACAAPQMRTSITAHISANA